MKEAETENLLYAKIIDGYKDSQDNNLWKIRLNEEALNMKEPPIETPQRKRLSYPMKKVLRVLKKNSPCAFRDFPFIVQFSTLEALKKRGYIEIPEKNKIFITEAGAEAA